MTNSKTEPRGHLHLQPTGLHAGSPVSRELRLLFDLNVGGGVVEHSTLLCGCPAQRKTVLRWQWETRISNDTVSSQPHPCPLSCRGNQLPSLPVTGNYNTSPDTVSILPILQPGLALGRLSICLPMMPPSSGLSLSI